MALVERGDMLLRVEFEADARDKFELLREEVDVSFLLSHLGR